MKILGNQLVKAINGFGDHIKADIGSMTPAKLTLTSTEDKFGVYCHRATFEGYSAFDIQGGDNWTVVVSADDFGKFVKLVNTEELELDVEKIGDTTNLVVEFNGKKYKFNAISTKFFGMDPSGATLIANVGGADLIQAVKSVSYAVDKTNNSGRPQLKCIHIMADKYTQTITAETLDGVRIARYTTPAEILMDGEVIVKKDDLNFIAALDQDKTYTISSKRNMFILSAENYEIALAQSCETFIDVSKIINVEEDRKIYVDKAELINALKRVQIFGSYAVGVEFTDKIKMVAEEDKGTATEIITGRAYGNDETKSMGVNPVFLLEAVQNADENIVEFIFTTKNIFVLKTDKYFALVLPVRRN